MKKIPPVRIDQPERKRNLSLKLLLPGMAAICFLVPSIEMQAQTTSTWIGGAGSWFNPANWDTGGVPNGSFNVIIDGAAGNSAVDTGASSTINIESLTVNNGDSLDIGENFDFGIVANANPGSGVIQNDGQIALTNQGNGAFSDLLINGDVSLDGSGTLTLGGGNNNTRIIGQSGSNGHLTNSSTIQGTGQIGANTMQLTNLAGGLIDANQSGRQLIVDPNAGGVANAGTMRASNGGELVLSGSGSDRFDNTGGRFEALNDSTVRLTGAAAIDNGTLESFGTGRFVVGPTDNGELQDVTLIGQLDVETNSDLELKGTINNQGQISLTNPGNGAFTDIEINDNVSLTGGGLLTLGGVNNNSRIHSPSGNGVLTNVDNTIQGTGQIGNNSLGLVNQHIVDANVDGRTLIINPSDAGVTNTGTMRASNGGELVLSGSGSDRFDNTGGRFEAMNDSTVRLTGAAAIDNGTLESFGTGRFVVGPTDNGELQDVTLIGQLDVETNSDLELKGTINNQGQISLTNPGNGAFTDIEINDNVSLTGGGLLTLGGVNNNSRIHSPSGNGVLTNVDNTIQGFGQVGNNSLSIVNQVGGSLVASGVGKTLDVDVMGSIFTNNGNLLAETSAILLVDDDLINDGGSLDTHALGLIDIAGDFTNLAGSNVLGNGEVEADMMVNHGRIAPGASVGHLTLDTDLMMASDSLLDIELDGSGADLLSVTGDWELAGDLELALLGGFSPGMMDSFIIGEANTDLTGSFMNVANGGMLSTIGGEGSFTVNYGAMSAFATNQIVLSNFVPSAVPEPGSAAVFLALTSCLLLRRRKD